MLLYQQLNRQFKKRRPGFTLLEILVVVTLSVVLMVAIYGIYITSYQSYRRSINRAELNQNARISMERVTRDLRQTSDIITALPPTDTDVLNPAPSDIVFVDGHDPVQIQYIEYSLSNHTLVRKVKHYYFPVDTTTWVAYNAHDINNNLPLESIDQSVVKADAIQSLEFFGENSVINIKLVTVDNGGQFVFQTQTLGRNVQ